jgi:signal transduction histidine kinase
MSHADALGQLAAVAAEDPRLLVARALQAARDVLDMEVAYLAELDDLEQVFAAVGPGGMIAGVEEGRRLPRSEAYCDKLIAGVIPMCVPDTTANAATASLLLTTEMGVRSYVGVPIERPDGRVEGTLCCLSRSPDPTVAERELAFMRVLAKLLGDELARQQLRRERDLHREGMAAMAMHDLKSPVTSVLGYAEMLADTEPPLSDGLRHYVERIRRAGEQLSRLADHLLDVSRAYGDAPPLAQAPVDLGALTEEAAGMALPAARASGVELRAEVAPDLRVLGDRDALTRVVQNLVGNAIKYTPAGGRVDVRAGRAGDGIVVEVADTGPGIPEADQARVFEPFYRASAGRDHAPGSGLGLAVCRQVVAEHGGSLALQSVEGEGTTVSVALLPYESGSE